MSTLVCFLALLSWSAADSSADAVHMLKADSGLTWLGTELSIGGVPLCRPARHVAPVVVLEVADRIELDDPE